MKQAFTAQTLQRENVVFAGTGGVSQANRSSGFVPAFFDTESGRTELARFANGRPAPMHLIEGLPSEWAVARDGAGRILAIKPSVISGFVRDDRFYTREQAAAAVKH
jgi:hypothetical protein